MMTLHCSIFRLARAQRFTHDCSTWSGAAMHQQSWQDLWHMFLAVMAGEPIHIRLVIGMAMAFLGVMSLTGIADSFLPRRAARRYAAMYDMTPAFGATPPQPGYSAPPSPAEELTVAPDEPDEPDDQASGGDMRYAVDGGVNFSAVRRSAPPPPRVLRAQKP
jgi:hypothetical protein